MTAPSDTHAPEARAGRAAPSPRAVTRGEEKQQAQRAIVDWLHATFPKPDISVEGLISFLGRLFGRPISGTAGGGLLGFKESVSLVAGVASRHVCIGHLAMGGEAQKGRWLLQITGAGCGLLNDWEGMRELLEGLGAKLTRVDLAVDFLDGEYTVDDAVDLHAGGFFAFEGKMAPKSRVDGDWLDGVSGRSFYVGKAENGKMLRVYEKGRQLGNEDSEWVRFEVQLGNRDRVIPFDVLTERDTFFAGAYPALELMLEQAGERILTQQAGGEISVAHVVYHLKRCYGKALDLCVELGATNADLIEELRIVGFPRRVNPSSLAAGLTWAQVHAQLRK
ncbi:replication initiation factor domain-containing protein [Methylibium petroleiphilum]|uniref:replication initiation factor domain-containing protein n=1 Tax=Methylibium petroleiphilum TaxID=105560 RepID=UPI001AD111D0|nr:replication initiation factor domain-containing protein [Methylibium petroleiphilum]MBN9203855.1 replication initiation factor domain-containing protein [Methylibium petroleiphilum]